MYMAPSDTPSTSSPRPQPLRQFLRTGEWVRRPGEVWRLDLVAVSACLSGAPLLPAHVKKQLSQENDGESDQEAESGQG